MSMARKNSNAKVNANVNAYCVESATAHIRGVVSGFYDKGKKYDYVTIDVHHDYDEYYDRYKVAVSKNYDVPEDGELIELNCTMKSYKGEISLKEINADTQ